MLYKDQIKFSKAIIELFQVFMGTRAISAFLCLAVNTVIATTVLNASA